MVVYKTRTGWSTGGSVQGELTEVLSWAKSSTSTTEYVPEKDEEAFFICHLTGATSYVSYGYLLEDNTVILTLNSANSNNMGIFAYPSTSTYNAIISKNTITLKAGKSYKIQ